MCITELDPGGAERALVRVAVGLRQLGWQVDVVSLRDAGEMAEPLTTAGISVTALHCGGILDLRAVFKLRRHLRRQRPDVLLCFLHQANIVGRLAGGITGLCPVISGIRVADRRPSVTLTDRWSRGLSCHYVAVSRHVADVHADLCGIPADRVSVIHNGVDVPESRPVPGSQDDDHRFRILFVGRLTEQKRPQDLIDAVARLPAELLQRVQVDVLGDGVLGAELQERIRRHGLSDQVVLHGYQPDSTSWMLKSDVLVLPSAWEGLPNVVLEAMASGLPVIATNVDGVTEVVEDGQTGWLVPAGDVAALSEVIARVVSDTESRTTVADRALEAVQQRFCWDSAIHAYDQLLRQVSRSEGDVEKTA